MWFYENVTREQFEAVKDKVEQMLLSLGAQKADVQLSYEQKTSAVTPQGTAEWSSQRAVFVLGDEYLRVGEVLFSQKPFIVIEFGSYDDLINNTMEDAQPFPYDLSPEDMLSEVKYSLGIEPYPADNNV